MKNEDDSTDVERLLRQVRPTLSRPVPVPGARERSWKKIDEGSAPWRRRITWVGVNAVALVVIVTAGAWWWNANLSAQDTSVALKSTPVLVALTEPLRVGAFGIEFHDGGTGEATAAKDGNAEIALKRGGVTVRRLVPVTVAHAVVKAGDTTAQGVAFEVRFASDQTVVVTAFEDSVEVTRGERKELVRPGETWSSTDAAEGSVALAVTPAPVRSAPEAHRHWKVKRTPVPPVVAAREEVVTPEIAEPVAAGAPPLTDAERWENATRLVRQHQYLEAASEFEAISLAPGPYAGMALYEEGRLRARELHDVKGAQKAFSAYCERFPSGSLREEVELGRLEALIATADWASALATANAFLAIFPASEHSDEVRLLRANILRERGELAAARTEYEALSKKTGRIGSEALFLRAFCAGQRGDNVAARGALESYLKRFPSGAHRDEVLRALGRSK